MKHQLSRAALPLAIVFIIVAFFLFFIQLAFVEEKAEKLNQRFDETEKKIDAIQHQLDNLYGTDAQDQ